MTALIVPAIWLIVIIAGLPQLSETVYSPSLPLIAADLSTSETMVEYTLTIYLLSFALGTLLWGRLSDKFGRKPCLIAGFIVFTIGCFLCYLSPSIYALLMSRFIQGFGGSVGSVIAQAICRDAFHGPALGKVYSIVGSSLSIFPALGPTIGGVIAQYYNWPAIFLFLIIFACLLKVVIAWYLPETHGHENRKPIPLLPLIKQLVYDKKVMGLGFIVGACNGITFSYFAEGPFCLMSILGLQPSVYGSTFCAIAVSTMLGGLYSKKLHNNHSSYTILNYGLTILMTSFAFSSTIIALLRNSTHPLAHPVLLTTIIFAQLSAAFGICMATNNALSLALTEYKWAIGTASSLFGFFYYCLVSFFTLIMGTLHNGTLLPMPLYFLALCIAMKWIYSTIPQQKAAA